MRRIGLVILVVVGLLVVTFVVLLWLTPLPPPPAAPPPPPIVKRPAPPLQADAEGSYAPGYAFTLGRFRFAGFSLHPDAVVTLTEATTASEEAVPCLESVIRADAVHLRCEDPQVGTVIIDGRFLTRLVTKRLDASVVSAIVTVRSGSGEILYRARDSFQWHPAVKADSS